MKQALDHSAANQVLKGRAPSPASALNSRVQGPATPAPAHWSSHSTLFWAGCPGTSIEPQNLLGFLLFLIIFLDTLQEATSTYFVFNMLSTHINPLGKILALNLLVYNNANSMAGNTVDPVLPW